MFFEFQSTSPVWRTTKITSDNVVSVLISIHVPRVEDDMGLDRELDGGLYISIHVPRVEDDFRVFPISYIGEISIHVPRVEDDEIL